MKWINQIKIIQINVFIVASKVTIREISHINNDK